VLSVFLMTQAKTLACSETFITLTQCGVFCWFFYPPVSSRTCFFHRKINANNFRQQYNATLSRCLRVRRAMNINTRPMYVCGFSVSAPPSLTLRRGINSRRRRPDGQISLSVVVLRTRHVDTASPIPPAFAPKDVCRANSK